MRPFTANRGEQSEAKPLPNGIYYVKQQERDWDGELDVFGVLRLRADGDTLWHGQLRVHFLGKVLLHVYKEKTGREEEATQGPGVPTSVATRLRVVPEENKWKGRSNQTWNPFLNLNDPMAQLPADGGDPP